MTRASSEAMQDSFLAEIDAWRTLPKTPRRPASLGVVGFIPIPPASVFPSFICIVVISPLFSNFRRIRCKVRLSEKEFPAAWWASSLRTFQNQRPLDRWPQTLSAGESQGRNAPGDGGPAGIRPRGGIGGLGPMTGAFAEVGAVPHGAARQGRLGKTQITRRTNSCGRGQ